MPWASLALRLWSIMNRSESTSASRPLATSLTLPHTLPHPCPAVLLSPVPAALERRSPQSRLRQQGMVFHVLLQGEAVELVSTGLRGGWSLVTAKLGPSSRGQQKGSFRLCSSLDGRPASCTAVAGPGGWCLSGGVPQVVIAAAHRRASPAHVVCAVWLQVLLCPKRYSHDCESSLPACRLQLPAARMHSQPVPHSLVAASNNRPTCRAAACMRKGPPFSLLSAAAADADTALLLFCVGSPQGEPARTPTTTRAHAGGTRSATTTAAASAPTPARATAHTAHSAAMHTPSLSESSLSRLVVHNSESLQVATWCSEGQHTRDRTQARSNRTQLHAYTCADMCVVVGLPPATPVSCCSLSYYQVLAAPSPLQDTDVQGRRQLQAGTLLLRPQPGRAAPA